MIVLGGENDGPSVCLFVRSFIVVRGVMQLSMRNKKVMKKQRRSEKRVGGGKSYLWNFSNSGMSLRRAYQCGVKIDGEGFPENTVYDMFFICEALLLGKERPGPSGAQ
jgi:hypothetical protein